jgi:hypothetical protein
MQPFELINVALDIDTLQKEVKQNYECFDLIPMRRIGKSSPHAQMTDIWVRYNDQKNMVDEELNSASKFNEEHDSVWYPVVEKFPSIKKVCFDLMAAVEGERLGGILITKLPPQGKIHPHVDGGWHASYYDKFYVPITAPKGSLFGFVGGDIHSEVGQAWWFDNSVPHWVENPTDDDRLTMIVCIRTEKFKDKNARRI